VIASLALLIAGLAALSAVLFARAAEARAWRQSLLAFKLTLPQAMTTADVARWLVIINAATHAPRWALLPAPPVALEVVATTRGIEHFLLVPEGMRSVVLSGLGASLPGIRLNAATDYFGHRPHFVMAAEAALSNHRRPLHAEEAATASLALLASLQPLHASEEVRVQWGRF
jgi:hypothetical protein